MFISVQWWEIVIFVNKMLTQFFYILMHLNFWFLFISLHAGDGIVMLENCIENGIGEYVCFSFNGRKVFPTFSSAEKLEF